MIALQRTAALAAMAGALLVAMGAARADYPERPVTFIVGFAAGGSTDVLARLVAKDLSDKWGQPVVVENRTGANGTIAAGQVAQARPDGYTIGFNSSAHAITPNQIRLSYDPLRSFSPITMVTAAADVISVNPKLPVNSIKELIALAKSRPGKLNYGTSGAGTPPYFAIQLLMQMGDIEMTHVPYKGGAEALAAVVAGQIDLYAGSASTALTQIRAGGVRPIGVSSPSRTQVLPDVPAVAETLPGYEESNWILVYGPAGIAEPIVRRLNSDIVAAVKSPAISTRLVNLGFDIIGNSPEDAIRKIKEDMQKYGDIMRRSGEQTITQGR